MLKEHVPFFPGMCRCCHKRPAAGYVVGKGIYLAHLCLRCWKKGANDDVANSGMPVQSESGRRMIPKPVAHAA